MRLAALLVFAAMVAGAQTDTAKQIALGKALVSEVEKKHKPLGDRVVSDYINALGKRLSAAGAAVPLTIRLVSAEEPLAGAFPGAYLVLSSGLIRRAGNESELAGVMAHQIAHIAAGHASGTPARAGVARVPLIYMGSWDNGICTRMRAGQALVPTAWKQTAEQREAEADALARQYLEKAGYDPSGQDTIFTKLRREVY